MTEDIQKIVEETSQSLMDVMNVTIKMHKEKLSNLNNIKASSQKTLEVFVLIIHKFMHNLSFSLAKFIVQKEPPNDLIEMIYKEILNILNIFEKDKDSKKLKTEEIK